MEEIYIFRTNSSKEADLAADFTQRFRVSKSASPSIRAAVLSGIGIRSERNAIINCFGLPYYDMIRLLCT